MEIHFNTTLDDVKQYYEFLWQPSKAKERNQFYLNFLWYLAVLSLGGYTAFSHDEMFVACIFTTLFLLNIYQNRSFLGHWDNMLTKAAEMASFYGSTNQLLVDESGLRESFSGVEIHVHWAALTGYTLTQDRLFIHFHKGRAFVIPLRQLKDSQREELFATLTAHGVQQVI